MVVGALLTLIATTAFGSLRQLRWVTALATGLSIAILLGLFLGWSHLKELDEGLLAVIQGERSITLDRVMVLITRVGDFQTQLWAGVLLCVLLLVLRQWRAAIFSILTLLGTAMANGALKASFARVRPEVLMEPLSSYSFPSGHSSAAFAFFSPWAYSPAATSRHACAWPGWCWPACRPRR